MTASIETLAGAERRIGAPLLSICGLEARYGAIAALKGVDLEVRDGEIVTLIGANGAGKSTLMMTICGDPRAHAGSISFAGHDLTRLPTHAIARLGVAQSPEGRRIFARMSVLENLQMGATVADDAHFAEDLARVYALFPRLKEREQQRGGTLSGGEQQMLAIGRALMSRPRLLLLDEPSLGLAPLVARQIFDAVRRLNREQGLTVFFVEQNAYHALKLADRGYVMMNGRIVMSGGGLELLANPEVRAAYLEGARMIAQGDLATWIASAILLDVVLGGAAAASVGRALARAWRPFAVAPLYMIPLAAAISFLHYAIFGLSPIPLYAMGDALGALPSAPLAAFAQVASDCAFWAGLTALLTGFSFVGYRLTRRAQMTERYDWLFARAGFWSWRERP